MTVDQEGAAVSLASFLDVGHGDCCVLVSPSSRQAAVVDCPKGQGPRALGLLHEHGVQEIAFIVVSHLDADHVDGVVTLVRNFCERHAGRVRALYYNHDRYCATAGYKSRVRELVGLQARCGVEIVEDAKVRSGETCLELPAPIGFTARLIYPRKVDVDELLHAPNEASAVVVVEANARTALLMGDLMAQGCGRLLNGVGVPRADVVKMPHHGGWHDQVPNLLDAASPGVAVISCGRPGPNDASLPAQQTLDLLAARSGDGLQVMCTELASCCCPEVSEAVRRRLVRTLHKVNRAGRPSHHGSCVPCAGSIHVSFFEDELKLSPCPQQRQEVLAECGVRARCRSAEEA